MGAVERSTTWGYPRSRPFLLLTIYFSVSFVQVAAVAARPPLPDTRVGALWIIAALSAALALATAASWLRWLSGALPWLVAIGVLQAAASVAVSAGGQGQLIAGFYLAVLGVYSGYFLSNRSVRVVVVLGTVSCGLAFILNDLVDSPFYGIAVIVLADGLALVVSSLAQHLRAESVHDPLTGAVNRRGLQDAAPMLHDLDARHGTTTAIVEIDLDGFKQYNDQRGHQAGDDLLTAVVQAWSRMLRRTDLLARTGGDEFVLILPATTVLEAEALLNRLREAHPAPWSAGIVLWRQGDPLPLALRQADEAMYEHKPRREYRRAG